jgi:hemerythrin-like domain-containing protein
MDDVFELLTKDHERLGDLFSRLRRGRRAPSADLGDRFARLERWLAAHLDAEEAVLYETLRRAAPTRPPTLESVVEHRIVRHLLRDVGRLAFAGEEWWAQLFVLEEYVTHHVQEEERELFPAVREALDGKGAELAAAYVAARDRALAASNGG